MREIRSAVSCIVDDDAGVCRSDEAHACVRLLLPEICRELKDLATYVALASDLTASMESLPSVDEMWPSD